MPVVLFSSKVSASLNIASHLISLGFEKQTETVWLFEKTKLIDTKVESILEVQTNPEADYFIVLSTHKSEAKMRSLTVHLPGNWDSADMGGSPRTLNISYPSMQRVLLLKMHEKNQAHSLNFNVNFEVDHHGPTISKPIIFVEIGSSEDEWKNPLAGKIVAESLFEMLQETPQSSEPFFGAGGGHYAPKFTQLALEKEYSFGHMLPKYKADSIAEDTFAQALEKNLEKPGSILIDKKGLNGAHREKLKKLADNFGIETKEM